MADADVVSIGRRQVDEGQIDAGQIDAGQSDEGRTDGSDHDKGRPVAEPLLRSVVGDLLRRERSAQERTLSDVADAAQVSKPYLSEVERGRKEPSSEVLGAICRSLGISLGDLVGRAHRELVSRATPLVHQELVSPAAPQRLSHPSGPVLLAA